MSKKVLHVAETIKGGIATVLRQLASKNDTHDVFFLVPDSQKNEITSVQDAHLLTFKRTGRNIKSFISLAWQFSRNFIQIKPDVVHLHSSYAGFICRIILPVLSLYHRSKVIYCPHAFSFIMNVSDKEKKKYAFIERNLQKVTDDIICVSKFEYNEAVRYGLKKEHMQVIYNGVESPIETNPRADLLPADKVNIIFVGRFDYQKAFDLVLDLADRLDEKFHITVIGGGVNSNTEQVYKANITYTGWLQKHEIANYFSTGNLLFMPSRWESFGLVAIEAQSYGMPVIASNCSSLPEVVLDGKTGFLFPIEDVDSVISILNNYNESRYKDMGIAGKAFYKENFLSQKMNASVLDLYNK